ncbi:MAG: hypothetical protein R3248_03520 [Candidatus Promineifilaceae bacterium]|nr:hypothetical protein [Candidatus Promineifilaceae bacterium]
MAPEVIFLKPPGSKGESDSDDGRFAYLEDLSDEELVEAFNKEVGKPGWTNSRAKYFYKLREEFERRNIDYSAIGDETRLSLNARVSLELVDGVKVLRL